LIRLSYIVFVHAILLSVESVVIEILTTQLNLGPLIIASSSSLVAGTALLFMTYLREGKQGFLIFKLWKLLIPSSILVSLGLLAFFDSIQEVGASKVALLSGPFEVIVIVVLARMFLTEKLSKPQLIGVIIALGGFFITVSSGGIESQGPLFRWGDAEAVISSILLGAGIVFASKIVKTHSIMAVTGTLLLISGIVLLSIQWLIGIPSLAISGVIILIIFSIMPLTVALTYMIGIARVGVSLTSIIGSFSILLTSAFQLILAFVDVRVILPSDLPLAIVGGILGIIGIYLVHQNSSKPSLIT